MRLRPFIRSGGENRRLAAAFTRLELMAVLCALALLASVALPVLGGAWGRSEQAVCLNNLRQIGKGFQIWGSDHNDQRPWWVPQSEGGTAGGVRPVHPLAGNTWFQFSWISNELGSAKLLKCPADPKRRAAADFSASPEGGLLHCAYRNNAVSYCIGIDLREMRPEFLVAADRDLACDDDVSACSSGIGNGAVIRTRPIFAIQAAWTNELHEQSGNLLFFDGRVESVSQAGLLGRLAYADENGSVHLLMP